MKKGTRKSISKTELTGSALNPADRLDVLEENILSCIEKIHNLERENAELQYSLQEQKYKPLQAQDQSEKKLSEKDQMIRRQQTLIQNKEKALQDLHEEVTRQQKELKLLTEQNHQLNREVQELKTPIKNVPARTESASRDQQADTQVRQRIEQAMEKLEQLERLLYQS